MVPDKISQNIRRLILEISYHNKAHHVGSCLSCVELLQLLFESYDLNPGKDKVVLSKGHAALAYYSALCQFGYINEADLKANYLGNNSNFPGHVSSNHLSFVPWSSGALGHGLSVAMGLALRDPDHKVAVICSDGELQTGQFWEAVSHLSKFELPNLKVLIDLNSFQATCASSELMDIEKTADKFIAFGLTSSFVNGHHLGELRSCDSQIVIAKTIKGKGARSMENTLLSHYKNVVKKDLEAYPTDNQEDYEKKIL
ncbi:thiamine pyrophosphate-dependent enzyme [bacterium]|nr:thiamine pyrophosphate-dependent enzyme [bacterium]